MLQLPSIMATSTNAACGTCARCGADGHLAAACRKPFLRPLCRSCDKLGHVATACPKQRREEALDAKWFDRVERETRVTEAKDLRRLEKEVARVAREASRRCWKCGQAGHLAWTCGFLFCVTEAKSAAGSKDDETRSESST